MSTSDSELEYSWLERSAIHVKRAFNPTSSAKFVQKFRRSERHGHEVVIASIRGIEDSGISFDLSPANLGYRFDFGFWVVLPKASFANRVAEMAEALFGAAAIPNTEVKAFLPRDTLIRDYFRSDRRILGVFCGYAPDPRSEIPQRLCRDVAYFSHAIAALTLGETLVEPHAYFHVPVSDTHRWLGNGSPLSTFKCPDCFTWLKSYEVSCLNCHWNEPKSPSSLKPKSIYDFEQSDT